MNFTIQNAVHNKTGNIYNIINVGKIVNCTNEQDGQEMILYYRDGKFFVREREEFEEKFTRR